MVLEIVGLIVAVLGSSGITAIITAFLSRRQVNSQIQRTDADAAQVLTDTSLSMLEPMRKQIEFLNGQLKTANEQISVLNRLVEDLTEKVNIYELKNKFEFFTDDQE